MLIALAGLAGLTGLYFLAYAMSRNVLLGWYLFLAANTFGFAFGANSSSLVGLNLTPLDGVGLALLTAGIMRFSVRFRQGGITRFIIAGFLLVFLLSWGRGVAQFGFFIPSNQSRGFIGELMGMLYFFTVPTDEETLYKMVKAFLWSGVVLIVVVVLHFAGFNIGMDALSEGVGGRDRGVNASAAFVIALGFFLSLSWQSHYRSTKWFQALPVLLFSVAVLVQHRTVWNVLIAGSVWLIFLDVRMVKRFAPTLLLAMGAILLLAVFIFGSRERANDIFTSSATDSGTWNWRVSTWGQLIESQNESILWVVAGRPLGTPQIHYDLGSYEDVGPHNQYVAIYLNFGLIGLALYLAFLFRPLLILSRRKRLGDDIFPSISAWQLIVIGIIVFGVSDQSDVSSGVLLGIANAMSFLPNRSESLETEAGSPYHDAPAYALQDGNV